MKKSKPSEVAALEARANAVSTATVRQTVALDVQTFEKLVAFIESEGCSLQEGLRRAVRVGTEALTLEGQLPPTVDPATQTAWTNSPTAGFHPTRFDAPPYALPVDAPEAPNADYFGSVDYASIAPPGV